MRFSYRLQSLLNWKKNLEEYSQMRLAEKALQLKAQEEKIQRLKQERFDLDQRLQEKMKVGVEEKEYALYKLFAEENYRNLLDMEAKKKRTQIEMEKEREQLIGLMKERKILETLKEKKLKRFVDEMEKLDQKNVDEMVIQRYKIAAKEEVV
jgi:flagellar protein FliJ